MGYFADNFDYVLESIQVVHEVYFGKTKEVLAIEKAIHNLREPYLSGKNKNNSPLANSLRLDPNKRKLEDAICNAFGFSDTFISIQNSYTQNAYTQPTSYSIDLGSGKLNRSARRASSKVKGYRFDPKDNIVFTLTMFSGVILNPEYTDAELTAIILHEIGHNFTATSERGTRILTAIPVLASFIRCMADIVAQILQYTAQGIVAIGAVPALIQEFIEDIVFGANATRTIGGRFSRLFDNWLKDLQEKNPGILMIIGSYSYIMNIYTDIIATMQYFCSLFPNYFLLPVDMIGRFVRGLGSPTGYADEKFADSFPRMYGYGPELVSALDKMALQPNSSFEKAAQELILPLQAVASIYCTPYWMMVYLFDEHPYTSDRAKFMVQDLKAELNDKSCTLSPATKKQMIQDAEKIQEELDAYLDSASTIKASKELGIRSWQNAMQAVFGGSIKGKIKARNVNKDINRFFDDLD
jgi:hypothetical protein